MSWKTFGTSATNVSSLMQKKGKETRASGAREKQSRRKESQDKSFLTKMTFAEMIEKCNTKNKNYFFRNKS